MERKEDKFERDASAPAPALARGRGGDLETFEPFSLLKLVEGVRFPPVSFLASQFLCRFCALSFAGSRLRALDVSFLAANVPSYIELALKSGKVEVHNVYHFFRFFFVFACVY